MVTDLNTRYPFPDRLDNTPTLMSKNDGEYSFWIFPTTCIFICVTYSRIKDVNPDLTGLWRLDFDIFD